MSRIELNLLLDTLVSEWINTDHKIKHLKKNEPVVIGRGVKIDFENTILQVSELLK